MSKCCEQIYNWYTCKVTLIFWGADIALQCVVKINGGVPCLDGESDSTDRLVVKCHTRSIR